MCLFNLINQDNRIGLATVSFSQIATVFISHITRRGPMRRATACFPSIPTYRCVLMLLHDRIEIQQVPSTTESFLHCSTPSLNPPLLTRKGYLGPAICVQETVLLIPLLPTMPAKPYDHTDHHVDTRSTHPLGDRCTGHYEICVSPPDVATAVQPF